MRKFKQQFLAGPYLIWIIGFILLPLGNDSFTMHSLPRRWQLLRFENVAAIADEPVHVRSMGLLSLKLGIICTIVCLVVSLPARYDFKWL